MRGGKRRQYLAVYDDGHDFGETYYYSDCRNNSKGNRDDAISAIARKYGYNRARRVKIVRTTRIHSEVY